MLVTASRPGQPALQVRGRQPADPVFCCSLDFGRLDRSGARYLMLTSYSGGLHCCTENVLILPDGPRTGVVPLGAFEEGLDSLDETRDMDGDGRVDFVRSDVAFAYAFASYAESRLPPRIWNVLGGRLVDVSSAPRYRPIYRRYVSQVRPNCLEGDGGLGRDAACAAYVAAAMRLGEFETAWSEMVRVYARGTDRHYPGRLRHFLIDHHYIAR